jgi:hypothetical protein
MKRVLKVKHTAGVRYIGLAQNLEYIGESRIDGFPMYSFDDKKIYIKYHYRDFVFNGRPGYTPTESDFELVTSLEDVFEPKMNMTDRYSGKNILGIDDIIPVQALPLPEPIGILYYFDYVLGSEFDNRLLLML